MRKFKDAMFVMFLSLMFCLLFERTAHAYIDPGIGSIIFQVAIGGLIGAAVAIKVFWKKIVLFFKKEK